MVKNRLFFNGFWTSGTQGREPRTNRNFAQPFQPFQPFREPSPGDIVDPTDVQERVLEKVGKVGQIHHICFNRAGDLSGPSKPLKNKWFLACFRHTAPRTVFGFCPTFCPTFWHRKMRGFRQCLKICISVRFAFGCETVISTTFERLLFYRV